MASRRVSICCRPRPKRSRVNRRALREACDEASPLFSTKSCRMWRSTERSATKGLSFEFSSHSCRRLAQLAQALTQKPEKRASDKLSLERQAWSCGRDGGGHAGDIYGVVFTGEIDEKTLAVDHEAIERQRRKLRASIR